MNHFTIYSAAGYNKFSSAIEESDVQDSDSGRLTGMFNVQSAMMTPNSQAISNILFSVHNMFGNAQSMFAQGMNS